MFRKVLLATATLAAPFAVAGVASAQPVTGLYIGAAGGGNFMQPEQAHLLSVPGLPNFYADRSFDTGYVGLGSVGYGFGNGFRAEIEGNYRTNNASGNAQGLSVTGRERKYGTMVNVLFDLDVSSPYIYPYIGVGAGYAIVDRRIITSSLPLFSLSDSSKGEFAYQAIAGVSLPIPPVVGLSLTAEYRFYSVYGQHDDSAVAVFNGAAFATRARYRADFNHSLLVGLRYAFNVAPPPVAPAAVVTPPPASEAARTYLVFFDWDRADLTPRARQVVAEAAKATTRVQVTRIEVNGYTDTSGSAPYNQGLSVRRAQTVANELTRDGVPRQAISIQGYGQTHLLVPTADGVREPQNRRVEIILH